MIWPGCAAGALFVALSLGAPTTAAAEERPALVAADTLRVEWSAPPGGRRLAGYLYNDNIMDAAHVWLRVDELASDGQVSAAHRRRLFGEVRSRGRMAFDVSLFGGAAAYRVIVESVDWVMECR